MKSHTPALSRLLCSLCSEMPARSGGALSRRAVLQLAAPALLGAASAGKKPLAVDVGIVGAGLAGLSCAYELRKAGVRAQVYEASERSGGRCYSMGGQFPGPANFPGQVVERGGEFIDNLHKTILAYAKEFRLTLEDVGKAEGEVFYFLDGARAPESKVVEEFRAFVPAMQQDLRRLSPAPTADAHTPDDVQLDRTSLAEYLQIRGAGSLIRQAIEQAYLAEYGRSLDEQSCLNFLLFIHADRRSKFTPFGVFSDERYHIVEGNEAVAHGLASRIAGQIQHGKTLAAARTLPSGRIRLTFTDGRTAEHDAVVLTVPFSVLRNVDLTGLGLPAWKAQAIQTLGYGDNAKLIIGFQRPYWRGLGCNGSAYADLANIQATWETNPTRATSKQAVLTDYASGARGKHLNQLPLSQLLPRVIADLEQVLPGATQYVSRAGGTYLAHLEHWPSNPLTRGSYTCYLPGQFTSIGGNEGKPVGNTFFAGEHADSFFEWQGFMEGALRSGVQAAQDILRR